MSGVVAWSYFADCLAKTANTFRGNAGLFGKIYFPRLIVPISIVITNMVTFLIQFGLFLLMLGFYWFKGAPVFPNYRVIILPLLILQMALLGLGVGAIVSSVLNPMVPIIETFRFAFLGRGVVEIWQLLVSLAVTLVIFFAGILIFTRVERDFMDTV